MPFLALLLSAALQTASAQVTPPQTPAPPPPPFDCSGPEYRQFDFWLGDWDVRPNPATSTAPPAGQQPPREPGHNVITKIHGGCVVLETWDDRQGGTGQSFNIFDRVTQRWHQTWVDNGGGLHFYWGELKDGKMVYLGEVPLGPAARVQGRRTIRVTFVPMGPDGMRQYSEMLNSDGTWVPGYDLIYTRRGKAK
jgi:hypothetical protein